MGSLPRAIRDIKDITALENRLAAYTPNRYDSSSIPDDKKDDVIYRYNRLSHHYGGLLMKWSSQKTLTEQEKYFRFDLSLVPLKTSPINELYHYFTGPVQKKDGGLPSRYDQIADLGSPLVMANLQIQSARLSTFSRLPYPPDIDKLYTGMMAASSASKTTA